MRGCYCVVRQPRPHAGCLPRTHPSPPIAPAAASRKSDGHQVRITRTDNSGAEHTVDKETSFCGDGSVYVSLGIDDQDELGFCHTSLTMRIFMRVAPTDGPRDILEITTKPETLRKYSKPGWEEAPLQIELRERAPAASSAPLVTAPSSGGGGLSGGIPASGVSRPPTPPTPASLVQQQQQQHAALDAAYASAPAVLVAGLSAGSLMQCDGQLWQAVFTSTQPAGVAMWAWAPPELHFTLLQWQRFHPHLWWQKLQEYAAQLLRAPVPLAAMMAAQSAAAGTGAAAK